MKRSFVALLTVSTIFLLVITGCKEQPTPPSNITVSFYDGDTLLSRSSYKADNSYLFPAAPTKNGFVFKGWKIGDILISTERKTFSHPYSDKEYRYDAVWEAMPIVVEKVTVTFDTDGGSTIAPVEIEKGQTVAKPDNPTKEGFTFAQWQLNGLIYDFSKAVNSDITLKATWEEIPPAIERVIVTFDTDGGSTIAPVEIEKGQTVAKPDNPTKIGHIFKGWYLDKKGNESFDFNTSVTQDITIFAIWETEQYTITFVCGEDVENAPLSQTIVFGSTIKEPIETVRPGYALEGWSTEADGSNLFDFNTPVTTNIALYPVWKVVFTVSFYDGDKLIETRNITPNTDHTFPLLDQTGDLAFGGWILAETSDKFKPSAIFSLPYAENGYRFDAVWEDINNYFSIKSDGVMIKIGDGLKDTNIETLTIPSTINGKTVTSIGDDAFEDCSSLTSITIPDGVTSIGHSVFYYCTSLTSITIPDSVTSIGWSVFSHCSSLPSITIPYGVTSIEDGTFFGCSDLTSITIPDGVTSIGDDAFEDCSGLTSVNIPDSVTSIGDDAFSFCSNLTSVKIGNSVTSIGDRAFYACENLTDIIIGNDVTSIGFGAFSHCHNLTDITIPNSVTSIGDDAFYYCYKSTKICIDKIKNSINGSPWGAPDPTVIKWKGES